MRLTRRRALLGMASLALPSLSQAREQGLEAGVHQLAFWGGWTGPDGLVMQRLVSRFNAETRDVQVSLTLYNWDLIFDRWREEFNGGSPPDIVGIHATEVAEFVHRGMLRDISRDASALHLHGADFLPVVWSQCTVGDALYAIPLDFHPLGLYINAREARRAGLDPLNPPSTEQELLTWAARLTNRSRGTWGYAAPAGDVECFREWYTLLYQYGGRFLDRGGARCLVNSAAGINAYTFLRDAVATRRIAMPGEAAADADFLAEKLLMYVQGPWYCRGALQAGIDLVTAPMPRIAGRPWVWANSHVLAVVSTQDAGRASAAMRFISWIHSHSLAWANAGQVPASNAARARLQTSNLWFYLRAFASQLPSMVYQPNFFGSAELFAENRSTPVTDATRAVMLEQETPAQAVRIMADQVNRLLLYPAP